MYYYTYGYAVLYVNSGGCTAPKSVAVRSSRAKSLRSCGEGQGSGGLTVGVNGCASVGGVCIGGGSWPRGSVSI